MFINTAGHNGTFRAIGASIVHVTATSKALTGHYSREGRRLTPSGAAIRTEGQPFPAGS
jgi:hypothetical protein